MVMLLRWTKWKDNGHSTEVANLMEGEWSFYGGGQFKGGRMMMLRAASLMEGELCYRCDQFNRGKWSCYRCGHYNGWGIFMLQGQFNGGKMVMLQRWPV